MLVYHVSVISVVPPPLLPSAPNPALLLSLHSKPSLVFTAVPRWEASPSFLPAPWRAVGPQREPCRVARGDFQEGRGFDPLEICWVGRALLEAGSPLSKASP